MTEHAPSKSLTAMRAGSPLLSIMPTSLDDVARIAKMAVMAGLVIVPKKRGRQDDDEDQAPSADVEGKLIAAASMIILQGLEVGLPPMQSLQTITLINGRPLIWGDAVPALIWRAGFKIEEWVTGNEVGADGQPADDFTAHCKVTRPDGTKIERTFSVADAKRAKLWDPRTKITRWVKDWKSPDSKRKVEKEFDNDAPWHRFWKRMLAMRARGFAVKDGASDVTRGLYLREEYEENEIVDVTPKKKQLTAPVDDGGVPDISADDASDITDPVTEHEPLAEGQQELFLEKLREDVLLCMDDSERATLAEDNTGMLERLSDANRRRAEAILDGRER